MFGKYNSGKYKHLAGISKEQEKQCLQKWRKNSDFSRFLKMNISKLCHRILIIFFPEQHATQQLLIGRIFVFTFFYGSYHPFSKL